MKIIRLAADKVKVILSGSDLLGMNIDAKALSPSSPELDLFLCQVLEAVREETGFSASSGQVIAEAALKESGLVLTLSQKRPALPAKIEYVMFELSGFDSLCGMLQNVSPLYLASMRLYQKDGAFYLAVPRRRIPAIIYEFSLKNRRSALSESIIREHGTFLAGGYRLLCMAKALKKIN